jgi:MFS transporter, MHS family, proline/betaine transporter
VVKTLKLPPSIGFLAALMSELFPPATRATGLGSSYNIGVTIFGGMAPATMAWMGSSALFGDIAPGYYLTFCAVVSLCALVTIRRTCADDAVRLVEYYFRRTEKCRKNR